VHILGKRITAPAQHANIQYLLGSHHFCDCPRKARKTVNKIRSTATTLQYTTAPQEHHPKNTDAVKNSQLSVY
jgi:hypothetical protein